VRQHRPTNLRTFLTLWMGQLASILGSEMTNFAITIWAWQFTEQATPIAMIAFFAQTPKVIVANLVIDDLFRYLVEKNRNLNLFLP